MFKYLSFFLLTFFCTSHAQEVKTGIPLDSITHWINTSNDYDIDYQIRLDYAKKAYAVSNTIDNDSLSLKSSINLAFIFLEEDDLEPFKEYSLKGLQLASKLEDSLSIAKSHDKLGLYYSQQLNPDSAYYHYFNALKLYEKFQLQKRQSSVLLNMVLIQEAAKDYVGGEANAVKAINLISALPQTEDNLDTLWSLYNMLGVISERLSEYQRAIDYHNLALDISAKMEDNFINNIFSTNNIALSYRGLEDYPKALEYHNKLLLNKDLIKIYPEAYATYLNNRAFTQFKA